MYVAALERVVASLLVGAVVENAPVLELLVVAEERFDQQLLGPAHTVAHRPDDRVLADHDADVAREEQVRQRRERVRDFVQRTGDRPAILERALDHERHEIFRGQRSHLFGERVGRDDFQRACRQEFSYFGPPRDLDQRVAHFMDVGEALQHRDQTAMLALRDFEVDDVVVEVVFARAGGDGDELFTGGVNED